MASEIQVSGRVRVRKASVGIDKTVTIASFNADMAGDGYSGGTQSIPTSAAGTAVTVAANVTTFGVAVLKNNDLTNYLELGVQVGGTFYVFAKLLAGESYPVRLGMATNALYARSNTAACILDATIFEA